MKNTMKKILFFLTAVMLFVAVALTVSAAETIDSGFCGDNVSYTLDSEGTLTISGTGDMADYNNYFRYDPNPWYDNPSLIKMVIIEDGVTGIGDDAFYDCTSLTSVTIPDSVTSIGNSAFLNCTSLTSVTIPDSVTSIGNSAFYGCTSLTTIVIPDSVASIGSSAFGGTVYYNDENNWHDGILYIGNHLIGVDTSVSGTYAIKDGTKTIAGGAFHYCNELTSVAIPDSVTSIGDEAFCNCTSLTSVTIPASVTSIGNSAFYYCTSLTTIVIPDSVASIGNSAFYGTVYYNDENNWQNGTLQIGNHLIEVETSVSGTYAIKDGIKTIAGEAFASCTALTAVSIPDSVTNIGDAAFYDCTSLTSVVIPDSVTSISDRMFSSCISLTSVTIPDCLISIGGSAFYSCTALTSVTIPDSVTSIGESAFHDCTSLTSVTIPNGVTQIARSMLEGCTALTAVTIPPSVTTIRNYAFTDCSSLTDVYISDIAVWCNIDINNSYSHPLDNNEASLYLNEELLTDLVIPDGVTCISDYAFHNCTALISVTIPDSVMRIGDSAFDFCTSLKTVNIPENVTSIGQMAFRACISLTSITLPDSVTNIAFDAFEMCATEITVDSANANYSSDEYGVLFNKDKTTLIYYPVLNARTSYAIPDSVTRVEEMAFMCCLTLTSVTIPDSVMSIGGGSFYYCQSLMDVYYFGTEEDWNAIEIASDNDPLLKATIHFNYSATNIVDSGTCGENLTWTLDSEGTLTISGTGDMYDYEDEDDMPWDSDSALIKSVIIENGVTSIGTYAFAECKNIESVSMPESMVSVDGYAFTWCESLRSIYIPKNVENIGLVAVACAGVDFEEIIVDPENQYYTSVDGVLYNKDMTQLITYPTGKKDSVFEMPDTVVSTDPFAFSSTHYLETVIMSDKLSVLGDYSFEFCSALKNITFGDGLTALTTWQFYKCTSLESVIIPENIVKIGRMAFDGCEALTDVTILNPDCEIREVEIDGDGPIVTNRTFPKDVVMHGYENSTAQEYAEKYGCEFVSLGEYVPTKISQTVTDSQSGIQLEYSAEAYPQEVTLQIEEVFDGSLYLTQQYGKIQTWNIKTCIDGEEVQPAVPVLVRLPLPDDYNADTVTVYHVNLQAGVLEQIQPVTVENGYICFMASSFSPYIIVDESSIIENPDPEEPTEPDVPAEPDVPEEPDAPDEPDDPSQNCSHLCHSDGIMGFFWKIIRFFWKLFKMNPVCECGAAHY